MKKIEMKIQCPSCKGTGVYVGLAERDGAAVVCYTCKGTGEYLYKYEYEEFTGRKIKEGVTRVYKESYGYVIAPTNINFKNIGEIDLAKEGISYQEFIEGKLPLDIKSLACPLLANQSVCHEINGFVDRCNSKNDGWLSYIPDCTFNKNKEQCWKIFNESIEKTK